MNSIDWAMYPRVAGHSLARDLLLLEASLGHASNTLDAYARGHEDFFTTCSLLDISPDQATHEHVALWVRELTTPSPRGALSLSEFHQQLDYPMPLCISA
jgi:hypothetical protein